MNFKYYDFLSSIIMGYFALVTLLFLLNFEYSNEYTVAYIACAFVLGYIINALASYMECIWYILIGGKPSNKLLTLKDGVEYTGTCKVRFYHAKEAIRILKEQLGDSNASTEKMFSLAMRETNSNSNSRVPDFNAHYAFSRSLLTVMFFITVLTLIFHPFDWWSLLILLPSLIAYFRYKDHAYYYAREVLNEYLKNHSNH